MDDIDHAGNCNVQKMHIAFYWSEGQESNLSLRLERRYFPAKLPRQL